VRPGSEEATPLPRRVSFPPYLILTAPHASAFCALFAAYVYM
jgi:hypothetical protein